MRRPAQWITWALLSTYGLHAHGSHPVAPLKLEQRDASNVVVAAGGAIAGTLVRLTATSSDSTCDSATPNYQLELEVRPLGTPFLNSPTHSSTLMAKPNCAEVVYPQTTVTLGPGEYHWQVRERVGTSTSSWVAFAGGGKAFTLANGPFASPSANPLQLGPQRVGLSSAAVPLVLTNLGNADLDIAGLQVSAPFALESPPTLPVTLTPGQTLALAVTVTPVAAGAVQGTLEVVSNDAQSPTVVNVEATGAVPQLSLAAQALAFGEAGIHSAPLTKGLMLVNPSPVPLTITQSTTAAPFSVDNAGAMVIPAGGSHLLTVAFAPTSEGAHGETLSIASDDPGSPHTVTLSGEGVAPQLALAPASYDFGELRVGQSSAPQTIDLHNPGTGTLVLGSPSISGPFQLSGAAAGATLAQGATVPVTVVFSPSAPGAVNGAITFASNDAASPAVLTLSGVARAPAMAVSPATHDFGPVDLGQSGEVALTVTNTGDLPLSFNSYLFTGGHSGDFSLVGAPSLPQALAPSASLTLTARFTPSNLGSRNTQLALSSDRFPSGPLLVPLSGLGAGARIALHPTAVSFGEVGVGTSATGSMDVSNAGSTPLTVSAVSFSGAASTDFSVQTALPLVVAPSATLPLVFAFQPSGFGTRSATATVQSNDALQPGVNVSLRGTGLAPQLKMTPEELSFGSVRAGYGSTRSVTFTNLGNSPLTLTAAQVTGPQAPRFNLGPLSLPQTLAPGGLSSVQITFAPTTLGMNVATLQVSSNDPWSPTGTLTLTGTSTSPSFSVSSTQLDFGAQQVGRPSVAQTLWLWNRGGSAVTVLSLQLAGSHSPDFTHDGPIAAFTIPPGERLPLAVRLTPSAVAALTAQLVIKTDDLTASSTSVALEGVGVSQLWATSHTELSFGPVPVGTATAPKELTLTNLGRDVLVTVGGRTEGPQAQDFRVTSRSGTLGSQGTTTVQVVYQPQLAGSSRAVAALGTTDPRVSPIEVSLRGLAVSGRLSVHPAEVDFQSVEQGDSSLPVALTLTNQLAQPLVVQAVRSTHPAFVVSSPFPISMEAGGTAAVSLTFQPTQLGYLKGLLQVSLEGEEKPALQVPVTGTSLRAGGQGCGCGALPGAGGLWLLALVGVATRARRGQ